jgi:hypothetical protein
MRVNFNETVVIPSKLMSGKEVFAQARGMQNIA